MKEPPAASRIRSLLALVVLLFLMDQLYRLLHPEVDLVRACLVGVSAWATLRILDRLGVRPVPILLGGLAVFGSAFFSVLAIQAGWIVSRSPLSVLVHVLLLAIVYGAAEWTAQRLREPSTA